MYFLDFCILNQSPTLHMNMFQKWYIKLIILNMKEIPSYIINGNKINFFLVHISLSLFHAFIHSWNKIFIE